jgi:DNA-binding transcriptional ArsR family regulator
MGGMPTDVTQRTEKIPHPPASALDLPTILRTVSDPVRLEIVRLLSDGTPRVCNAIQSELGLPASTGSYHLRLLREAGVTRSRADGTLREISLRREDLDERFPGLLDVLTR